MRYANHDRCASFITDEWYARAIARVPAELRQVLLLRERYELSYGEIAELLNCPIGSVRARIFRAREELAAELIATR